MCFLIRILLSIGAAVNLTEGYPADTVTQTGEQIDGDTLVVPPSDEPGTRDLKWSHGPVSVSQKVLLTKYEIPPNNAIV